MNGFWLALVLIVIFVCLLLAFVPGNIARSRGHANARAIRLCGLLGLVFFPAWIFALVWAYTGPEAPETIRFKETDYHLGTSQSRHPGQTAKSDAPPALSRQERRDRRAGKIISKDFP